MEDKIVNPVHATLAAKRTEYLLEQILINIVGLRYSNLNEEDRKQKMTEALQYVDDDMKLFTDDLPPAKRKANTGAMDV